VELKMADWAIFMGAGGFFILLGLGAVIWDRSEKKGYYDAISSRRDVREYLNHQPERPEFGALKAGGRIAIAIGFLLLIVGGVFWIIG
jgi:predicted Rdx family selenoprotein